MKSYSAAEVARILDLTPRQVRAAVVAGWLEPGRGPRGELRFSFQDLVSLKTARGLFQARLPARRVRETLAKLRGQLPEDGAAAVRITVEGERIVASDGREQWQPESGQILFDFGGAGGAEPSAPARPQEFSKPQAEPPASAVCADDWYRRGCDSEAFDSKRAIEAYEKALAIDPDHPDAHINLGRLLHEASDAGAAEEHYRKALASRPNDPTAAFNLGVSLEDLGRRTEALAAYERAVSLDPRNADAHWNAANLCENLGRIAEALRHLKEYRALTRDPGR
ncbi:MAG TPA: tetratricopeptide repeat protein [Thermoanaerobaculia bacterium]|nr:tetratricopeptide repeat protein [Thermoanaerobaculia bacterium]